MTAGAQPRVQIAGRGIGLLRATVAGAVLRVRTRSLSTWVCAGFVAAGGAWWLQTALAFFGNDSLMWYHQDFPALYTAGRMVADGSGDLLYDTAALASAEMAAAGHPVGGSGVLAYFNPPFFALLLSPLSRLGLDRAYQVWTLFSLVLLAVDVALIWHIAGGLRRRGRLALVLAFVTMYPLCYGLQIGQFSLILVTSWAAAYVLLRGGHERWAGVALAPLLIKPELLLPVAAYLAWKRHWRVFSTLAPLTAAAIVVSVAVIGVPAAIAYPRYVLDSTTWHGDGVASNVMFDLNGIAAMVWERPSDSLPGLAVLLALTAITFAGVVRASRGALDTRSDGFVLQWALLTLATVLVDPHLYLQDTVLVVPAAAALLAATGARRRPLAAVMLLGWLLLAFGVYPNEHLHVDAFALYLLSAGAALALAPALFVEPAAVGVRASHAAWT